MTNAAFSRCPICRVPFADAARFGHGRVPCLPVEYVSGELVSVGLPRRYSGGDPRWTAKSIATVALCGRTFSLDCLMNLGAEFPDCVCDAGRIDAAILGRLLWPYPNTRVIADAALARAIGQELSLPVDLVFVDPGAEYFQASLRHAPAPSRSWRVA